MHQKYADKGLVCLTVSVDDPAKAEGVARAEKILSKEKAVFANYLLNEKEEVWRERWNSNNLGIIFVFDRQGKRAAKFGENGIELDSPYEAIEKLVEELLDRKP